MSSSPSSSSAPPPAAAGAADSVEGMRFIEVWRRMWTADGHKSDKPIGRIDLTEFYFWFKQWIAAVAGIALALLGVTGTAGIIIFIITVTGCSAIVFQKLYVYDDVMTIVEASFSESTMQSSFTFGLFWIVTHTLMTTLVY